MTDGVQNQPAAEDTSAATKEPAGQSLDDHAPERDSAADGAGDQSAAEDTSAATREPAGQPQDGPREVVRAEKLVPLDHLVSGVLHKILTSVGVIVMTIEGLSSDPNISQQNVRRFHDLEEEANRIGKISKELMEFASRRPPKRRQIDINEAITQTLKLMEHDLETQCIAVKRHFAEDLPPVWADSDLLRLVGVGPNGRQGRREPEDDGDVQLHQVGLQEVENSFDDIVEVDLTTLRRAVAAEVEQVLGNLHDAVCLVVYGPQVGGEL